MDAVGADVDAAGIAAGAAGASGREFVARSAMAAAVRRNTTATSNAFWNPPATPPLAQLLRHYNRPQPVTRVTIHYVVRRFAAVCGRWQRQRASKAP
jgi:hypothetical protein